MENTLVVYDNTGKIFTQITGTFTLPEGLPHIVIQIPTNNILISVNPSTHEPVFADRPKTEVEELRDYIDELEVAIVDIMDLVVGGNE